MRTFIRSNYDGHFVQETRDDGRHLVTGRGITNYTFTQPRRRKNWVKKHNNYTRKIFRKRDNLEIHLSMGEKVPCQIPNQVIRAKLKNMRVSSVFCTFWRGVGYLASVVRSRTRQAEDRYSFPSDASGYKSLVTIVILVSHSRLLSSSSRPAWIPFSAFTLRAFVFFFPREFTSCRVPAGEKNNTIGSW